MLSHSTSISIDSNCVIYIYWQLVFMTHSVSLYYVEESIIKLILIHHQMLVNISSKFQIKIYLTGIKDHEQS